jgi:hypothetical protein
MTHDPLCPNIPEHWDGQILWQAWCHCDLIAKVRADERAKYVLPDLPRGGEHVDWCRDLACYGCEEIADGVIAQDV